MGRKIILLSDGTGNSSAKVWRTNVWRTFEALDLSGNDQVAYYDDGVGTSSFKPLAVLGGVFGFGLRRNVIAIYKFACRNYRGPGDEFFGFGFSRGAFTIRIVMGLILSQGLVKAESESELDSFAAAAYRAYRRDRYKNLKLEAIYQWVRNKFGPDYWTCRNTHIQSVRFLGVWDTVSAYGLPIDEMALGIHRYLWPLELPGRRIPVDPQTKTPRVERACHALALDEERTTFHPQLWDEEPKYYNPLERRYIKDEHISQVWFAGVHSNVGGGYPDDSLAYIPFVWMITEAKHCGLKFKSDYANDPTNPNVMRADPDTFKNAISKRDKDGRLYDPRKGLGGYYRYGPRKLVPTFYAEAKKKEGDEVEVGRAKIHESVFKRIGNHAHAYAPVGIPPLYDVVTDDGEIMKPSSYGFETNSEAADRAEAQEHVWNDIWKRRVVYFATVIFTAWLLILPLITSAEKYDEYSSPIRWVADILRFFQAFLPSFASIWIDGYARIPLTFLLILFLVFDFLYIGSKLSERIGDTMGRFWRRPPPPASGLPTNWIYRLRSSRRYINFHQGFKTRFAPTAFVLMFVYLGFAVVNRIVYNIQDVAGLVCKESDGATGLMSGEVRTLSEPMFTKDFCRATGVLVDANARYKITITTAEKWKDDWIPMPTGGYSSVEPPAWYYRLYIALGVPLRRELTQDWFRIVLRYGSVGGEEQFYVPDVNSKIIEFPFRPRRSGEVFLFVNDAVTFIPGFYDLFYRRNIGTARITISRPKPS